MNFFQLSTDLNIHQILPNIISIAEMECACDFETICFNGRYAQKTRND